MGSISVEQLIKSPARLIEGVESGQLEIVTKDGRPLFLAVPYDDRLANEDVHVAVAIHLFVTETVSLGSAARIAGYSARDFIDRLGTLTIPIIRYSPEELERELATFS